MSWSLPLWASTSLRVAVAVKHKLWASSLFQNDIKLLKAQLHSRYSAGEISKFNVRKITESVQIQYPYIRRGGIMPGWSIFSKLALHMKVLATANITIRLFVIQVAYGDSVRSTNSTCYSYRNIYSTQKR